MNAADKPLPQPRGFLITPSASPPLYRPQPRHTQDHPSPTKRARLSSAPRSSSVQAATIDFHQAREDSIRRLTGTWDSLLEKWSRPLDEDDLIDITTLEVVKDRGALRGTPSSPIRQFIDLTAEDSEDDVEEVEEEDEADGEELATLNSLELWGKEERKPTSSELELLEAQLRREFLEAEQRRKAAYGSEVDESEGPLDESHTDDDAPLHHAQYSDSDGELMPVEADDGSEDELGGWDDIEGNTLYRLPGNDESDDEGIDHLTRTSSASPEIPFFAPSPTSQVDNELATPLLSHGSSHSPPPTSPPRSSSPFSLQTSSPIRTNVVSTSKYRQTSISRPFKTPARAIPRLDLREFSAEQSPSPKPERHRGFISSSHTTESHHTSSPATAAVKKSAKSTSLSAGNRTKSTSTRPSNVEVVIAPRTPSLNASLIMGIEIKESAVKTLPMSATAKGKQKAIFSEEHYAIESSHPEQSTLLSEKNAAPKPSRGHSRQPSARPTPSTTPRAIRTISSVPHITETSYKKAKHSPLATVALPSSPSKKRKRIVSSMESEDVPKVPSSKSTSSRLRSRAVSPTESSHRSTDVESVESEARQESIRRKDRWKHGSRQRSSLTDDVSDDSDQSEPRHRHRQPSRAASQPPYPYPQQYPSQQYPPHHQQSMYPPLQDPRAQYIVSQAMHQLLALGSGTWGPPPRESTPFAPMHPQHHRSEHLPVHLYGTPTHHIHPYPYSYDPILSNATLPPDSPDVHSRSSPRGASSVPRRKSLVKRGQSRGRKVSFRREDSVIDASDASETSNAPSRDHRPSTNRHSRSSSEPGRERRKEFREVMVMARKGLPELESDSEPQVVKRGRSQKRHQTPAPSSRAKDHKKENHRASSSQT